MLFLQLKIYHKQLINSKDVETLEENQENKERLEILEIKYNYRKNVFSIQLIKRLKNNKN